MKNKYPYFTLTHTDTLYGTDSSTASGTLYSIPSSAVTFGWYYTSTASSLEKPVKKILRCSKCKKRIGQIKVSPWSLEPEEVLCETCRKIEKLRE